jgi:hypothetical protein
VLQAPQRTAHAPRPALREAAAEPAPEPALEPSSLADEAALLERALTAMREGDLGAARSTLAAHAARFPAGALARERRNAESRLQTIAAAEPGGTHD